MADVGSIFSSGGIPDRVAGAAAPAVVALALLAPVLSGCADRPAEWVEADGARWRELTVSGGASGGFASVDPADAGIDFENRFSEENLLRNDILANGAGVALGDFDGDGRTDVFLAGIESGNALYRNLGGWRFEDVTDWAGVALDGSVSRGAVWADIDGDDDLDLLVTRHSEPNVLFRNDGEAGFTDASADAGFEAALASHTLALADTDGDGDLDLYITNYKDRWARDTFSPADRAFDRVIGEEDGRYFVRPAYEDYYRVIETEEGIARWEFAEPDEYYLNDGGRFTRVRFTGGAFIDAAGEPLAADPDEWGLAARFADLDLDGDADLYVCNDINSPDHIWLNDGSGGFQAIGPFAIRKTSHSSMAVDVADVNRDGAPDIFVGEMLSAAARERKTQVPEWDPEPARPGEILLRPQVQRNTLLLGRGDGTFAEVALQSGVAASGWTWGVLFADVDLDGFEDLITVNGHVLDFLDGDAQARTAATTAGPDWRRLRLQFPRLAQRNRAFRNLGDGTFEDASDAWGVGSEPDISQGLAAGDLDGDGDQDLVINRLGAAPRLLRNDAGAPRVTVRLRGAAPNTRAIGARVRLRAQGWPTQETEVAEGGLYLSDSDGAVVFAAPSDAASTVEVVWPDGVCTRVDGVRASREIEVTRPPDGSGAPCARPPAVDRGVPDRPFEDVTDGLGHVHHEEIYAEEFSRQPLIALRLAQLGPGLAWIDDDRDGDPDLWIGSGRGGRATRAANEGGSLRAAPVGGPAVGDQSTILPAPPGSGAAVLIGQMNYEAPDPAAGLSLPAVLGLDSGGGAGEAVVEGGSSAAGALAAADVDGDGDLDLFVGGRVIPTAYPIAASSRVLRADGGRLVPDPVTDALLRNVGLVSGAVFSDVDSDGDPDLLLALEWGPVKLYRNDGGRFADATSAWGLDALRGRWNGIATGDLDGDGRPDAVVTGWGSNTEAALDGTGTAAVYGDFDRNGTLDFVELARSEVGDPVPAYRLQELARGLPFVRRVAPDNRSFAAASLSDLLGPGLSEATRVEATELRHLVLMNRGTSFEPVPLPAVAQRTPAFGVAIADFDADGNEDVVLAQNFYATKLQTPRYDAGRGLVLLGDGTGGLTPLGAALDAYGDGRGLAVADYDADGRPDLAIGQNGGPTRLYRNVFPRAGLRVRLRGPPGNPDGVGAAIRLEYPEGPGPLREVQAGSGYWSSNGPVQVMGMSEDPVAVVVRWPGGGETRSPVPEGMLDRAGAPELGSGPEVSVDAPPGSSAPPSGGRP